VFSNPNLIDQLRTHFQPVVEKKLKNQIKRAKALGYRTALILDQVGPSHAPLGANWLSRPGVVWSIVDEVRQICPGILDGGAVVDPRGEVWRFGFPS
jgi:hypothetical protein